MVPGDGLPGIAGVGRAGHDEVVVVGSDGVEHAAGVEPAPGRHRERSPVRIVGNLDAGLVRVAAVHGSREEARAADAPVAGPERVNVTVADTAGLVDHHPLLVATLGRRAGIPGQAGFGGTEDVAEIVAAALDREAIVINPSLRIRIQHGIGAEDARLDHPGEGPGLSAVGGVAVARLAEIARDGVELPPADHHLVRIGGVHGDGRLVGGVADDVLSESVDVHLDREERIPGEAFGGGPWMVRTGRGDVGVVRDLVLVGDPGLAPIFRGGGGDGDQDEHGQGAIQRDTSVLVEFFISRFKHKSGSMSKGPAASGPYCLGGWASPKPENPADPTKTAQSVANTAHIQKTRKLSLPGRTANRYACRIPPEKGLAPQVGLEPNVRS